MKRRTPMSVAIGSVIAIAGLIAAPIAQAQPVRPAEPNAPVMHRAATTKAEQRRVSNYWTPDRMRSAKQRNVRPGAGWQPSKVKTGEPKVEKGQRGTKPEPNADTSYLGGPWTGGGAVVQTTGKVFFTLAGVDYVCSGSVTPAGNKSTVATAGHCVNEGPGDYATNFAFVPGYDDGDAPYGTWTASTLTTSEQWRTEGDFNYDIGFAIVSELDGQSLADAVGSQSIGFNQSRGDFLYSFGYPQASPYDGTTLDYCSDTATDDTIGGSDDQRLDCNMTGGSSGGPWFDGFDESAGTGVQVSVNSFGYTSESDAMYGPYFGSVIQDVYNSIEGD